MKTKPQTTTIPAMAAAQIACDEETEKACHGLLADEDLSPAKQEMVTEILEVVSQRRREAQAGLAARLARFGHEQPSHKPNHNDGRLPRRGSDGRQPANGRC
jgi:hypothetical protein